MSNQLQTLNIDSGHISIKNINQAMDFAKAISESTFCPEKYKNRSADIVFAIDLGLRLGLGPTQSLQDIAVINGKPTVFGDAMLSVCMAHRKYIKHNEYFDEETQTATCEAWREGGTHIIKTFSKQDAQVAGLWGKAGPWRLYPRIMLYAKARNFCMRAAFPDALKGIIAYEEAIDYPVKSGESAPTVDHERILKGYIIDQESDATGKGITFESCLKDLWEIKDLSVLREQAKLLIKLFNTPEQKEAIIAEGVAVKASLGLPEEE